MALKKEELRNLLNAADRTHDEEIDCDEFLQQMAAFAEWRISGAELPSSLALAAGHERICPTCREECAALIEALEP